MGSPIVEKVENRRKRGCIGVPGLERKARWRRYGDLYLQDSTEVLIEPPSNIHPRILCNVSKSTIRRRLPASTGIQTLGREIIRFVGIHVSLGNSLAVPIGVSPEMKHAKTGVKFHDISDW